MNDIKKEINKVDDPAFWKERLRRAKERGEIQMSVYESSAYEMERFDEAHKRIIGKTIKLGDKVLDAGCGYGRATQWFTKDQYIGIDLSPDFISEAKERNPGYKFIVGGLKKMPFGDLEFEYAVCLSVRHMIIYYLGEPEWNDMLKELKRVAKYILFLEYTSTDGEII